MDEAKRCIALAIAYFPFKIQRLQWDNGSESQKETEAFVLEVIGNPLNHTPPHTPKRNGLVERLNKTTRDEEVGYRQFKKEERKILAEILQDGVWKYNFYRPHLSFNLHTPMEICMLFSLHDITLSQAFFTHSVSFSLALTQVLDKPVSAVYSPGFIPQNKTFKLMAIKSLQMVFCIVTKSAFVTLYFIWLIIPINQPTFIFYIRML